MISLLVHGSPVDRTKTPWGIYEAAYAVGFSRRAARELAMSPEFVAAYEREKDGRGNAGMIPSLDDLRREMQRRRRDKSARPAAEAIAAAAQPAPLAPGYVIRLDTSEPEDEV
jgi:hypothetical protein